MEVACLNMDPGQHCGGDEYPPDIGNPGRREVLGSEKSGVNAMLRWVEEIPWGTISYHRGLCVHSPLLQQLVTAQHADLPVGPLPAKIIDLASSFHVSASTRTGLEVPQSTQHGDSDGIT
jgi:hypothetical protein